MNTPQQEWTEHELCEALKLTRAQLQRMVMEKTIPPPHRVIGDQRIYTERHADLICERLRLQDWQQRLQKVRKKWELNPDDLTLQLRLTQLLSLRRLFGEGNRQGLHELQECDVFAPDTIYLIVVEMQRLPVDGDLFSQLIALLYDKVVLPQHKKMNQDESHG